MSPRSRSLRLVCVVSAWCAVFCVRSVCDVCGKMKWRGPAIHIQWTALGVKVWLRALNHLHILGHITRCTQSRAHGAHVKLTIQVSRLVIERVVSGWSPSSTLIMVSNQESEHSEGRRGALQLWLPQHAADGYTETMQLQQQFGRLSPEQLVAVAILGPRKIAHRDALPCMGPQGGWCGFSSENHLSGLYGLGRRIEPRPLFPQCVFFFRMAMSSVPQWLSKQPDGAWVPYPQDVNQQLEAAYSVFGKHKLGIRIDTTTYIVDFKEWTQFNPQTGASRDVRREEPSVASGTKSGGLKSKISSSVSHGMEGLVSGVQKKGSLMKQKKHEVALKKEELIYQINTSGDTPTPTQGHAEKHMGHCTHWHWESQDPSTGQWLSYTKEDSDKIEAAYQTGQMECVIHIGSNKFIVLLHERKQYNHEGGYRHIRRAQGSVQSTIAKLPEGMKVQWQSEDPATKEWVPYPGHASTQLESAHQNKQQVHAPPFPVPVRCHHKTSALPHKAPAPMPVIMPVAVPVISLTRPCPLPLSSLPFPSLSQSGQGEEGGGSRWGLLREDRRDRDRGTHEQGQDLFTKINFDFDFDFDFGKK